MGIEIHIHEAPTAPEIRWDSESLKAECEEWQRRYHETEDEAHRLALRVRELEARDADVKEDENAFTYEPQIIELDLSLLWERVGEIRTKQMTIDKDSPMTSQREIDRQQAWVAGILQAIQIIETGEIADVSEDMWDRVQELFPFPEQTSDLGGLADYRQFEKPKDEVRQVPAEVIEQTFPRPLSEVEILADPTLAKYAAVTDATGEEPDAVVSDSLMNFANVKAAESTERLSDG